jgi:F-type H+-transporting ATPase subunit c
MNTKDTNHEKRNGMKKISLMVATMFMALPAFADATPGAAVGSSVGLAALGVGLMMGLAVLGGASGQGKAAAAALDGLARNPAAQAKLQTMLIISLALMESLVLFAFLIGFILQGRIGAVLDAAIGKM